MAKAARLCAGVLAAVFIYGLIAAAPLSVGVQNQPLADEQQREHPLWDHNRSF